MVLHQHHGGVARVGVRHCKPNVDGAKASAVPSFSFPFRVFPMDGSWIACLHSHAMPCHAIPMPPIGAFLLVGITYVCTLYYVCMYVAYCSALSISTHSFAIHYLLDSICR